MTQFKSITDVRNYLNSIPMFGKVGIAAANFSLDSMLHFCKLMGNPEYNFRSVHVAGTNGKGTTCQMLASVYQQAGCKTGLYTSPHLISFNERIRINGENISDSALLKFFQVMGDHLAENPLTYFELSTCIAFWYFSKEEVDIAIIETGLGGRLDATNVITPEVSIITSIGLDHTDILGDTIEKIAAEKGGIIKTGRPVVCGVIPEVAENVIKTIAAEQQAPFHQVSAWGIDELTKRFVSADHPDSLSVSSKNRKNIDARNVAAVFETVRLVNNILPVSDEDFVTGIENTDKNYPDHAHFQKIHPEYEWYFDGAHNSEASVILAEELKKMADPGKWTVILSFMKDKATPGVLNVWNSFPCIYYYEQESERASPFEQIGKTLQNCIKINHPADLLNELKTELVIFTGSFYFYSIVMHWMGTLQKK